MKRPRFFAYHMILSALAGACFALAAVALALWFFVGPQCLAFLEAWGLAQTQFVGEYDPDSAMDSALGGLVDGLGDRWSYYLNAEDYAAQNQRRSNSYVGIGVTISYEDLRGLLILSVKAGGPADQAGLKPGEIITAVDGFSLAGEEAQREGSGRIQGEAGVAVTLTVLSPEGEQRQVEAVRAPVQNDSVSSYTLLEDDVGYVALSNFYSGSAGQLNAAVDDLVAQGARALVFDMRNNGGGYVSELTDMLDHLLPEGPIFRSRTKSGKEEVVESDAACVDLPMAVLVNANTYSAAEFFAAQLRESGVAVVVGDATSGKGYSQQAIPLPNGGAVNLSTGKYFTGEGVSLIGTGVTLDRELSLDREAYAALVAGTLEPQDDVQLLAALELLK